jgi:hypothetical protein
MHFSHHLAEALVPEWRQHYINYEALKDKLKQVRHTMLTHILARLDAPGQHSAQLQRGPALLKRPQLQEVLTVAMFAGTRCFR